MIKKHTREYYNWNEVTDEVEKLCGKKTRDWFGLFDGTHDPMSKTDKTYYADFWHHIYDYVEIHQNSIVDINFNEISEYYKFKDQKGMNPDWIKEICELYKQVLGPSDDGNYTFLMEW